VDRLVLREITFAQLSSTGIAEAVVKLRALVERPILVVPHIAVRLAEGSFLAERVVHIAKTMSAARRTGLVPTWFSPTRANWERELMYSEMPC
jgi:hypothetical protein